MDPLRLLQPHEFPAFPAMFRMEDGLEILLPRINDLLAGALAEFRRGMAAAALEPFPAVDLVVWGGGG
ncbi:hypothetical protein ACFL0I_05030 [Gemmatimonadota bacterium]